MPTDCFLQWLCTAIWHQVQFKKPSLIFNVAQVDSEEDVGNEIMKSESQEVEINSLKIVHFYVAGL